jgi:hypothetical protein
MTCLLTKPQDQLIEGIPVNLLALQGFALEGLATLF